MESHGRTLGLNARSAWRGTSMWFTTIFALVLVALGTVTAIVMAAGLPSESASAHTPISLSRPAAEAQRLAALDTPAVMPRRFADLTHAAQDEVLRALDSFRTSRPAERWGFRHADHGALDLAVER